MKRLIFRTKRSMVIFLLLLFPILSIAQVVTGKVILFEDKEALPGVNVLEKGTTNGTITDIDGNFSIHLKSPNSTLVFSMVGMIKQEKRVNAGDKVDIVLQPDHYQLDQIVVTGYSTQKKSDLTGSVTVVSVDDMMKSAENNPLKGLQGRVPGMEITANGNPSGAATVRIRGIGTLNNNDPLFVIDGVPTRGGMHELNSNDIENIQVLKDASAASIYGSRAANGVIIVTTKKGKEGKIKLNFDAYVTQTFYNNKLEVMNAKEYGQALWQATVNSSEDPNKNNIGYTYKWGYDDNGEAALYDMYLPKYLDTDKTMLTSDTDWFDAVSQKGLLQSYNLSVSNGSERGDYFFSLGYLSNDGTLKYTSFDRFSARMNASYHIIKDVLTIGENFSVNRTSEVQIPDDNILDMALKALPLIPVHTVDGKGWGGPTTGMNDRHNPARLLYDNKDNKYAYWRLFGNAYINLQPLKGLNLRSSFGLDYTNYYKRNMVHSYKTGTLNNDLSSVTLGGTYTTKWTWSNTASYAKQIGVHNFDVLAGLEMYKEEQINFSAYKDGFLVETPEQMWPDMGIGTSKVTGGATSYALLSYFGKANYAYDNRYLASVTLRYDGSSRFGKNNRFGTFPAFSLGYRISEEAYMEKTRDWLSDLKLRFGWGQTGNQETANTAVHTLYVTDYGMGDPTWTSLNGTSYDLTGKGGTSLPSGYKKVQQGNPDLKWETTTQTNIGLDFGFFDQKLYGTAEYYIKKTKDILVQPPYLGIIGEGGYCWYNGASMENNGFEVSLGYRDQTPFGLSYDISGNISGYRNKVTKLPSDVENSYGGNGKGDNILGRPINSFYGYIADGLFRTEEDIADHATQNGGEDLGRIRYRDLNDDGKIDDDDRTWIGSPHPDFMYGLNIELSYKNFDLSAFFYGVNGIDVNTYAVKSETDFWSINDVRSNKGTRLLNAWSPSNPNSDIPAITALNENDEGRLSTYFIENGSFLKLRNLQLGYTLPRKISEKAFIEKFRIYVSGQNLFTIKSKNFSGVDPENAGFGYPIPTTFTVGVNIGF